MNQTNEVQTIDQMPKALTILMREIAEMKSILNDLRNEKEDNEDRWMTVNDLREYLPGHPKRQTIYCWVYAGKIPHHKPSPNRLTFLKSEIDKWLKIEQPIFDGDLDDETREALPVKACGDTISRKGGYK